MAVARGTTLLKSTTAPEDQTRSERLWKDAESLLSETGLAIRNVDVFGVCVGPGGFTGLRVGVAAIKGFAAASSRPIAGVTSLEAAAFAVRSASHVCSMVNAYKGEVYSQCFSFDRDGAPVAENGPMISGIEAALNRVGEKAHLTLAGDGAQVHAGFIADFMRERGNAWSIESGGHCVAEDIARLAFLKYSRAELNSAEDLKACYVRQSEAEIKLSLGLLGSKIKRSIRSE